MYFPWEWSPGKPCPDCGGPTMAATPGDETEIGDYYEGCGYAYGEEGQRLI